MFPNLETIVAKYITLHPSILDSLKLEPMGLYISSTVIRFDGNGSVYHRIGKLTAKRIMYHPHYEWSLS